MKLPLRTDVQIGDYVATALEDNWAVRELKGTEENKITIRYLVRVGESNQFKWGKSYPTEYNQIIMTNFAFKFSLFQQAIKTSFEGNY